MSEIWIKSKMDFWAILRTRISISNPANLKNVGEQKFD